MARNKTYENTGLAVIVLPDGTEIKPGERFTAGEDFPPTLITAWLTGQNVTAVAPAQKKKGKG